MAGFERQADARLSVAPGVNLSRHQGYPWPHDQVRALVPSVWRGFPPPAIFAHFIRPALQAANPRPQRQAGLERHKS